MVYACLLWKIHYPSKIDSLKSDILLFNGQFRDVSPTDYHIKISQEVTEFWKGTPQNQKG